MRKLVTLFFTLLLCVMITGCSGIYSLDVYKKTVAKYAEGIGTMSVDEAKEFAEQNSLQFESFFEDSSYKIPNNGRWEALLVFKGGTLDDISYFDWDNEQTISIDKSHISYIDENDDVKFFDTLAECEKYVFGKTTGTVFSIEKTTESSSSVESVKSDISDAPKEYNYDSLQNLFISITSSTTADEVKKQIEEKSLCFTSQDYNSSLGKKTTYVIAYTDGAAAQKYADSGDHLEVTFKKSDGRIMAAQYVNVKCSSSALYYNFGYWYDFSEREPGSYSGHYIVDPFSGKTGITIKYKNGNEIATNYFKKNSATEAIQAILDKI